MHRRIQDKTINIKQLFIIQNCIILFSAPLGKRPKILSTNARPKKKAYCLFFCTEGIDFIFLYKSLFIDVCCSVNHCCITVGRVFSSYFWSFSWRPPYPRTCCRRPCWPWCPWLFSRQTPCRNRREESRGG